MEQRKRELSAFIIILGILGVLASGALLLWGVMMALTNLNIAASIYGSSAFLASCFFAWISIQALIYMHKART